MIELDLDLPGKIENINEWKEFKDHAVSKIELVFLETALTQYQGNIKMIAENMGITSRAVYSKLKKYELNSADYRKN